MSEIPKVVEVPHEYRIRLDDAEITLIVEALTDYLIRRVRRAKRTFDLYGPARLLERLANPEAHMPSSPYWARWWTMKEKRAIYKGLREILASRRKAVSRSKTGTVSQG